VRNLSSASETTTRTRVLFALAALLLCAGFAQAQERGDEKAEAVSRPLYINAKPFEDIALSGRQLVEQGKLGSDTVFEVTATAEREVDGRLRPDSVQITWNVAPDEALTRLAQQALAALSESRVFGGLEGVKAVRLALKLDRQNVSFQVACETPSERDAEKYAEGYGTLAKMGAIAKRGTDEGELFKRLGFSSEGKMFKMSFEMPRAEAARMIADMLAKKAAKAAPSQD
jgi:hypothetical protein